MSVKCVKIKDFAKVITGGTPSSTNKEYWENGDIPWLNSGELNQGIIRSTRNHITKSGLDSSSAKMMPADSVLVALTGATTGVVGYLTFEACANQSVTGILPSERHTPKYLFYYLKSIRNKVIADAYGGAQPHISQGYVKDILVPLPPLEEQKKIAAILDAADKYRQKTKALIEKYDLLTQSLFLDMFGGLLREPSDVTTLEDLCGKGKYGSGASAVEYKDGLPRYLRITDINESGSLKSKKVSPSEYDPQYLLGENDLLFARTGATVGKTYLYQESDGELVYAGYLIKFTIPTPHNASYFFHFTKTNYYKSWVLNQQNVVAQPNINAKQYGKELSIPLPTIDLQNEFAARVAQIEKQKQQAEASLVKAEELFNSLLQRAFKGELTN